jgi:hypothetical protein
MEHLEGTERDAYFMQRKLENAFKMLEAEVDAPNKREPATDTQRQQESERRGTRTGRFEGKASKFY